MASMDPPSPHVMVSSDDDDDESLAALPCINDQEVGQEQLPKPAIIESIGADPDGELWASSADEKEGEEVEGEPGPMPRQHQSDPRETEDPPVATDDDECESGAKAEPEELFHDKNDTSFAGPPYDDVDGSGDRSEDTDTPQDPSVDPETITAHSSDAPGLKITTKDKEAPGSVIIRSTADTEGPTARLDLQSSPQDAPPDADAAETDSVHANEDDSDSDSVPCLDNDNGSNVPLEDDGEYYEQVADDDDDDEHLYPTTLLDAPGHETTTNRDASGYVIVCARPTIDVDIVLMSSGEHHLVTNVDLDSTTIGSLKERIQNELFAQHHHKNKKKKEQLPMIHLYHLDEASRFIQLRQSSLSLQQQQQQQECDDAQFTEYNDDTMALNQIFHFYRQDIRTTPRVYLATSLHIYVGVIGKPRSSSTPHSNNIPAANVDPRFPLVGTELSILMPESTTMKVATIQQKILQKANLIPEESFRHRTHLVWLGKNVGEQRESISWEDLQHQDLETLKNTLCCDGPLLNVWFDRWTIQIQKISTADHCNINVPQVLVDPTDTVSDLKEKVRKQGGISSTADLRDAFLAFGGRRWNYYNNNNNNNRGNGSDISESDSDDDEEEEEPADEDLATIGMTDGCTVYLGHDRYNQVLREDQTINRIPEPEFRGITLVQLRKIATAIVLRCQSEGWRRINNHDDDTSKGKLLAPEEVTFQDLNHYFVLPVTKQHNCSYVELVTTRIEETRPDIFCCHWMGGSVLDCLASLEQHTYDRNFSPYSRYWIDVFAIGPRDNDNNRISTIYRAVHQSQRGSIVVLDNDLACFRQIWNVFATHVAFAEMKVKRTTNDDGEYFYDVYAVAQDSKGVRCAVGMTDGLVAADKYKKDAKGKLNTNRPLEGHQSTLAKSRRLSTFPLQLCEKALGLHLERAEATTSSDKKRVLNAIIAGPVVRPTADFFLTESLFSGAEEPAVPPESHDAYDKLNARVRTLFAESAYRWALEQEDQKMEQYRCALSCAPTRRLATSFSGCVQFRKETELFLQSLPDALQSLDLDLTGIKFKSSDEFAMGLGRLQSLNHVGLKVGSSRTSTGGLIAKYGFADGLVSLERLGLELSSLPELSSLELSFTECVESPALVDTLAAGLAASEGSLSKLLTFKLLVSSVFTVSSLESLDGINDVLKCMPALEELFLDLTDNRELLSLTAHEASWARLPRLRVFDLQFLGCPVSPPLDTLVRGLRSSPELATLRLNLGVDLGSAMGATPPKSIKISGLGESIAQMTALTELDLNFEGIMLADVQEDFLRPLDSVSFPRLRTLRLVVAYHQTFEGIRFIKGKKLPLLKRLELSLFERGLWLDGGCSGDQQPIQLSLTELSEGFMSMAKFRQFDTLIVRSQAARPYSRESWDGVKQLAKAIVTKQFVVGTLEFNVHSDHWRSPNVHKTTIPGLRPVMRLHIPPLELPRGRALCGSMDTPIN
ncbi:expressed unknown protein [Seminavis robusta]|uniref:Uncharacterized protein n=1 Tax=Seminavis robusta TaxID=568900 RepID=A0A9N8HDA9_9STRA|nr:expressed unknown protein [Seminavis robusta]|eukprot:Sro451_g145720.1 n/a (1458) ;mRNA; f:40097-44470